jgi:hypothetical protein
MRRIVRSHPEGTLSYIYGMMILTKGQDRFGEAEEILLQAAKMPAVTNIRRQALFGALACEAHMLADPRITDRTELVKRAVANLRASYRPGNVHPLEGEIMAHVAVQAGDFNLARAIAMDWAKTVPDDKAAHGRRALLLFKSGDFIGAAESAAKAPDDPAAQKVRKEALDQIEMFLKKQR